MNACASCASSGVAVRPVPIAQTGSYASTSRSLRPHSSRIAATCTRSTISVSPPSRSSCVSPTQAITRRARPRARRARARATSASVSPKYCRRSEWPTSEPRTPSAMQHRRGDLAGVRALRLPVDVLRERGQAGVDAVREPRVRRADDRVDALDVTEPLRETRRIRAGEHLPVAGDDHVGSPPRREAPCPRAARGSRRRRSTPTRFCPQGRARSTRAPSRRRRRRRTRRRSPRPLRRPPSSPPRTAATRRRPSARSRRSSARRASSRREALARLGADVEPEPAVGQRVERRRHRDSASSSNADAPTTSLGSSTSKSSGFSIADLLRHLSADQHRVRAAAEVLQHAELVVHLRAAGDQDERTLDVAEQLAEMLELLEQQQPGVRREQMRDALRRRMCAVRGAERVVHVEVAAVGELARERSDRSSSRPG